MSEHDASFSTVCPKCKHDGSLCVTAFRAQMNIPLSADGFSPQAAAWMSTSDEMVVCGACDAAFPLDEVTL